MGDRIVYIVGAGGHGRVIRDTLAEAARLSGFSFLGCFADDNGSHISPEEIPNGPCTQVVVGIGDNVIREQMYQRLINSGKSLIFKNVSHPTAFVSRDASVGKGVVVFANSVVQSGVELGDFCIVNTSATVDHDCRVGRFSHIAPGVNLCGGVTVGARTLVGVGSCASPGVSVGAGTVIGAGSVIVSDIPANVVAYGNPCRVVRNLSMGSTK